MAAPTATLNDVVSIGNDPKTQLWAAGARKGKFGHMRHGIERACDIRQKRTQEPDLNIKNALETI